MFFGKTEIKYPVCLAPMEDVSDPPFRHLCKRYGADVVYTEFVSSEAIIRGVPSELQKMDIREDKRPIGIQLYGSNPESLKRAAALAEHYTPDFIDLNCGCWVKKIAMRGDGAGLLRDLSKLTAAVRALQQGTTLPVTVKTRLGWDHENIVILELVRMLQDIGIQSITVHCRTRAQGYSGKADWRWLPRIKEAAPYLPLIGNGDIVTPHDALSCFNLGCDGVMIGRAALRQPWVFREIRHFLDTGGLLAPPQLSALKEMCIEHLKVHVAFRGVPRGIYSFRRHYAGYFHNFKNAAHFRRQLMTLTNIDEIIACIQNFQPDSEEV